MEGVVTSGETIGQYRVLQTLGEGGMGVVYLGADQAGRNVAIKVLRPAVAGDATARRRLAREVDSMRRVHSPHVAEILDADVTAERPYIVTQYVPGRTLEEVVEDTGPIHGQNLQRLAVGLAAALSAIHGAGIVHRDMKPGNVMLVDGEPVVIDFGIAQAADATRLTATGMVIGTPGYLAPEIIEGEDAGPPSDVHAWAGTVAYAATGRPPFGSGTFESIFYKIMQSKPDLAGVPDALLPVLRAAMARHPAERPTAIGLVQLTRRIHVEATITDHTRIDDHYTRPDMSAALPAPTPPPPSATAALPPELESTAVDHAADHSRQFAMPAPPANTPTGTPTGPPPAQPKDFKGLLPPAAPPPGPSPYESGYTQNPYQQPTDNRPRKAGIQRRPGEQPPYQQQQRPHEQYPQQPDPYSQQQPPQQQPQHRPERAPDAERRKPYGLYRLISLLVLAALLAFANVAPLLALAVTIVGVLVLRAGDKAAKGMEDRRTRRGPRPGDAAGAAVRLPLHLPGSVMMTALIGGLSLLAGVVLLAVLMFAKSDMSATRAIAYSAMLVIALMSLAPGSGPPRRQLARLWGAMLPRTEAALAGVLIVGLFAGVLAVLSLRQPPDTTPLNGMSQSLESLRSDVRDLLSGLPFM
ncbi:serine/threonine-protein kinase [Actinomadura macrotermitis]|uniref:Serine/threonine-protein kinase PknD n=1 Tax=Actinomadura macrotermitis TaxID=2585200 RepID=A0A7K0BQH3_9ACTN|nr:serine/threonine-protein kinase [Actinomadura macrotermitis]MQY03162.1 Serine/threonine-protein kinase PknD [Actinomadura macrotermitis]